jgi:hypothetical protein
MPEGVIDLLEAIQVYEQQGHRFVFTLCCQNGLLEAVLEQGAIGKARQAIVRRLIFNHIHPGEQFLPGRVDDPQIDKRGADRGQQHRIDHGCFYTLRNMNEPEDPHHQGFHNGHNPQDPQKHRDRLHGAPIPFITPGLKIHACSGFFSQYRGSQSLPFGSYV